MPGEMLQARIDFITTGLFQLEISDRRAESSIEEKQVCCYLRKAMPDCSLQTDAKIAISQCGEMTAAPYQARMSQLVISRPYRVTHSPHLMSLRLSILTLKRQKITAEAFLQGALSLCHRDRSMATNYLPRDPNSRSKLDADGSITAAKLPTTAAASTAPSFPVARTSSAKPASSPTARSLLDGQRMAGRQLHR